MMPASCKKKMDEKDDPIADESVPDADLPAAAAAAVAETIADETMPQADPRAAAETSEITTGYESSSFCLSGDESAPADGHAADPDDDGEADPDESCLSGDESVTYCCI